jgi:MshEN domain
VSVPPIFEFLEVVKRSLGAKDVRIVGEDETPSRSEQVLVCELPAGQLLSVSFEDPPANADSARRRLEMLVRAFASTLGAAGEAPSSTPKGRALHGELTALVERAGALDAVIIDANSPVVWGSAVLELPEVIDEEVRAPDNVIRIDRQSAAAKRDELLERARELAVRPLEALAIDPRAMTMVPREICEKHRMIPLFGGGSGLLLAMADPTDLSAIHETVLATGLEVEPCIANERLIGFVLAWNRGPESRAGIEARPTVDEDEAFAREALARRVCDRWMRHFAVRRAIQEVRAMSEMTMLHRGGHLNRSIIEPDFAVVARSFAAIYVLIVVFRGPFDELRAKHAISQALPGIESLVLALPPRDPPPSIAGAKAMRKPVRR